MRSLIVLVVVLAVAFGIYYFAVRQVHTSTEDLSPAQTIATVGVENDLLAIAQAERIHFAEHGHYASLGELTAAGALRVSHGSRDGYEYSVTTTATGFEATARPAGSPGGRRYPTLVIDQTMQIRRME